MISLDSSMINDLAFPGSQYRVFLALIQQSPFSQGIDDRGFRTGELLISTGHNPTWRAWVYLLVVALLPARGTCLRDLVGGLDAAGEKPTTTRRHYGNEQWSCHATFCPPQLIMRVKLGLRVLDLRREHVGALPPDFE